jgi:hypothetical protein
MKRRNIQMAFVGEAGANENEDVTQLVEGDEAVDIAVQGGKVMLVVPAATPDDRIFEDASLAGGELILENGYRFSFEIKSDAVGAQFAATESGEQEDEHSGLSTIPDVPGGV